MKIAIFSDIHDNHRRWEEASKIIREKGIETGICCGDVQTIETLELIANNFKKIYLALGNADYDIRTKTGLIPDNVEWSEDILEKKISGIRCAVVHNDQEAIRLTEEKSFDYIFYGHTHTPWQQKIKKTELLNPGEVCGRYGRASFAIIDTETKQEELVILK